VNTDRLIELLSANLEPATGVQLEKKMTQALAIGGVAAFGLMLATVGPRAHLGSHLEWVAVKLLFSLSVVGTSAPLLVRSMRPGREDEWNFTSVFLPFLVVYAAAVAMLLLYPHEWKRMILGAESVSSPRCLFCILFFAAIPLAFLTWALRDGAPTSLKRCGAIAGMIAGAVGACVYAFTCASDSVPFIAIWYCTAIALCSVIGTQLGLRLLRW
jgi:hypothetical protein